MDTNPLSEGLLAILEETDHAIEEPEEVLAFVEFLFHSLHKSMSLSVFLSNKFSKEPMSLDSMEELFNVYNTLLRDVNPVSIIIEHNKDPKFKKISERN